MSAAPGRAAIEGTGSGATPIPSDAATVIARKKLSAGIDRPASIGRSRMLQAGARFHKCTMGGRRVVEALNGDRTRGIKIR